MYSGFVVGIIEKKPKIFEIFLIKLFFNFWRVSTKICLQSKSNLKKIDLSKLCQLEKKLRSVINIGNLYTYRWDWYFIREHKKDTEAKVCVG